MSSVRGKTASISAAACLVAVLVAVPSAQAAVTSSSITTPKNNVYFLYNYNTPNTFAISGTTNGTTGDYVDINCYAGDKTTPVATNVAVNNDGSFSVPAAPAKQAAEPRVAHQVTEVEFAAMSQEEIDWYVASGEPMDKAGAYAIQGLGARFVAGIRGEHSNVVGLPVRLLYELTREPRVSEART